MLEKTEAELDRETVEFWTRVKRWGPIIAAGLVLAFLIWRYALWLLWPLIVLAVLFYFVRSPWGAAARAWLLDRVFARLFASRETNRGTNEESINTGFRWRPLMKASSIDGEFRRMPTPAWKGEPKSDEHAFARIEWTKLQGMMPHLSRDPEGDGAHETRKVLLTKAEFEHDLHVRGDDIPIAMVAPAEIQPLAAPIASPVRWIGWALSSAHLWIMGALAAFGGWQFARAERLDVRADRAVVERDSWRDYAKELEEASKANAYASARDAARLAQEAEASKRYLEAERRRRAKLNQDLRRIENEASRAVGADVALGLRILTEPTDSGDASGAADPAPADPGVQPGMSNGGGSAPGAGVAGGGSSADDAAG